MNVRYREIENFEFDKIFRVYLSGSSGSGKTYFARELIKRRLFRCERVYYFHPDFTEDAPTDWQETLSVPVVFDSEFPTRETLMKMPEHSCIVLDDLSEQVVNSKVIDYLFRVLSRKKNLHVICMTQRYYCPGVYSTSIRNNSNFHVLMRHSDDSMTNRIARSLGLMPEFIKAREVNEQKLHPYIFVDRSNPARVRKTEVFVELFSKIFIVIQKSMKYYLLAERDFKQCFNIKDCELAEYVDPEQKTKRETTNEGATNGGEWKQRRRIERQVERTIRKLKVQSKL